MTLGVERSQLETETVMCFIPTVFMETGLWVCFLLVKKQTTALKNTQLFLVSHGNIMEDPENSSSQKGVTQCNNISG